MKACKACGVVKPLSDFYAHKPSSGGFKARCKPCERKRASELYHASPEQRARKSAREKARLLESPRVLTPEQALGQRLWTHYRIRPERYFAMLEQQGQRCAVCRTPDPGGKGTWHVDHDHACCAGKKSCGRCVRALLCGRCNVGLGMFGDDISRLEAAIAYLRYGA